MSNPEPSLNSARSAGTNNESPTRAIGSSLSADWDPQIPGSETLLGHQANGQTETLTSRVHANYSDKELVPKRDLTKAQELIVAITSFTLFDGADGKSPGVTSEAIKNDLDLLGRMNKARDSQLPRDISPSALAPHQPLHVPAPQPYNAVQSTHRPTERQQIPRPQETQTPREKALQEKRDEFRREMLSKPLGKRHYSSSDYAAAIQKSDELKRPLVVVIGDPIRCPPCRSLDSEVLNNLETQEAGKAVFLHVNPQMLGTVNRALATDRTPRSLPATNGGIPHVVVFSESGRKMREEITGYSSASRNETIRMLQSAIHPPLVHKGS